MIYVPFRPPYVPRYHTENRLLKHPRDVSTPHILQCWVLFLPNIYISLRNLAEKEHIAIWRAQFPAHHGTGRAFTHQASPAQISSTQGSCAIPDASWTVCERLPIAVRKELSHKQSAQTAKIGRRCSSSLTNTSQNSSAFSLKKKGARRSHLTSRTKSRVSLFNSGATTKATFRGKQIYWLHTRAGSSGILPSGAHKGAPENIKPLLKVSGFRLNPAVLPQENPSWAFFEKSRPPCFYISSQTAHKCARSPHPFKRWQHKLSKIRAARISQKPLFGPHKAPAKLLGSKRHTLAPLEIAHNLARKGQATMLSSAPHTLSGLSQARYCECLQQHCRAKESN